MTEINPPQDQIISQILDIEEHMFTTVQHEPGGGCRQGLSGFQVHRRCQFMAWSLDTLESYLADLQEAGRKGQNLMTLKYARMGDQISPLQQGPTLDGILAQQLIWQREVAAKFPGLISQGRPLEEDETDRDKGIVSFATYLRCELETYSAQTLDLLWRDTQGYRDRGVNMNEQVYRFLASAMGYDSLEAAEEALVQ